MTTFAAEYAPPAFRSGYQPEIIGTDDRVLVTDTKPVPFRYVCSIERSFSSGHRDRTTGVLISPRHVLTVGHSIISAAFGPVAGLSVTPGRNGSVTPFGTVAASAWRTSAAWANATQTARQNDSSLARHDYGLITLASPIGTQLFDGRPFGFWGDPRNGGGTSQRFVEPGKMRGVSLNVCGYPADKCGTAPATAACPSAQRGSTQWRSYAPVREASSATDPLIMRYEMDTKGGHSGSPVWLRWQGARFLVAIHRGFDGTLNIGVRVTPELLATVRSWM